MHEQTEIEDTERLFTFGNLKYGCCFMHLNNP